MKKIVIGIILMMGLQAQVKVELSALRVTDYQGYGCQSILSSKEILETYESLFESYEKRYEKAEGNDERQKKILERMEKVRKLKENQEEMLAQQARHESAVFKFTVNASTSLEAEKLISDFGSWRIALSSVDQDGNHHFEPQWSYQATAYGDVVCDYIENEEKPDMKAAAEKAFYNLFDQ